LLKYAYFARYGSFGKIFWGISFGVLFDRFDFLYIWLSCLSVGFGSPFCGFDTLEHWMHTCIPSHVKQPVWGHAFGLIVIVGLLVYCTQLEAFF
jgi:hypothetical protein